jgi:hypothetical protein
VAIVATHATAHLKVGRIRRHKSEAGSDLPFDDSLIKAHTTVADAQREIRVGTQNLSGIRQSGGRKPFRFGKVFLAPTAHVAWFGVKERVPHRTLALAEITTLQPRILTRRLFLPVFDRSESRSSTAIVGGSEHREQYSWHCFERHPRSP